MIPRSTDLSRINKAIDEKKLLREQTLDFAENHFWDKIAQLAQKTITQLLNRQPSWFDYKTIGFRRMNFNEIAKLVEGIPYIQKQRGKQLYDHVIKTKPKCCLELGFAHGASSCYIAAALHEVGSGKLICVDLDSSKNREPNLETLLENANLRAFVDIYREKNSYTWFLKNEIEKNTSGYNCKQIYDLCFIDGPKNWTIDGLAFFLVDKLLKQNGFIIFDDYQWAYKNYSKAILDGIAIRDMSQDQVDTANIKLVFQLLVMQHPNYSNFIVDEDWAWAQKTHAENKTVKIVASQSMKYRFLKKLRKLRG